MLVPTNTIWFSTERASYIQSVAGGCHVITPDVQIY